MFQLLFVLFILWISPPFEASPSKVHLHSYHHLKGLYDDFPPKGPQKMYHLQDFPTLKWTPSQPCFKSLIKTVVKNKLFNLSTHWILFPINKHVTIKVVKDGNWMCKAHFCSSWSFRRSIFSNTNEINFPIVCCGLKEAFNVSDTKQIRVRYRNFKCISNYHNLKEYLGKMR